MGIMSILDIGRQALFASQAAIQTTGNNISNVDTEGYRRREVRFQERSSLDYSPGQLGTGVVAEEVVRHFDKYIEGQFYDKSSLAMRYQTLWENLRGVENLYNEANTDGINSALSQFFADWQDVSLRPDDYSTREALMANTISMVDVIRNANRDMILFEEQMDDYIQQEVNTANDLIQEIADINKQIALHDIPGQNNANELYDKRDLKVRELAEIMDIDVIDNGSDEFSILTSAGHTLLHNQQTFEIKFEGPKAYNGLSTSSQFDGNIRFNGEDNFEYMIEVVQQGQVSNGSGAAMFRVSLDGGRTWMTDDEGKVKLFEAREEDQKVQIGELEVWFDGGSGNDLMVGDKFTIVPKDGIYWYENTSTYMNITPQRHFDGTDNARRIVGGTLAGLCSFRDDHLGRYQAKLDGMAEALIWETNRLHSQGAGLSIRSEELGAYGVNDPSLALGSNSSGLWFKDHITSGNAMLHIYDAGTGEYVSNASGPLDFDPATPGIQNFDPDRHSLNDVVDAINNTYGGYLTADVQDNRLHITAADGYEFAYGQDSAGLWAGLGMNTFFTGFDAGTIGVNSDLRVDINLVAAGSVNGAHEFNEGDNTTALKIADLANTKVDISTTFEGTVNQNLIEYYNILVSSVGSDTSSAQFNYNYQQALAQDLSDRQEEVGGVNLDEEMSNLIKFQHSYTAAAKLITTADQMLQTLLSLKN